jgi:hypothetical protein
MILALLLLAASPDWVPAHWTSNDPKSLELLEGSRVNCVLVAAGSVSESFLKTATRRDIVVVGLLRPNSEALTEASRAVKMGVHALALEGDFEDGVDRAIRGAAGAVAGCGTAQPAAASGWIRATPSRARGKGCGPASSLKMAAAK